MQWEFEYVDLFLGYVTIADIVRVQEKIAQMGRDGWEPVCRVPFEFREVEGHAPKEVPQLMFKRPIS